MKDTGSRIVFRPVDEFERLRGTTSVVRLDELTYTPEAAGCGWRPIAGPESAAAVRLRGVDAKGYDWVFRKFVEGPSKGTGLWWRNPTRIGSCCEGADFMTLQESYDERSSGRSAGRVPD